MKFFIERPILAAACSAAILLGGVLAMFTLPVDELPQVTPPQITIQSHDIGANAHDVETAVTTQLEEQINGVEGLRYLTSASGSDGTSKITATFDLGRDPDKALDQISNRINAAQGLLPPSVRQTGVVVAKSADTIVLGLALTSDTSRYDTLYLSNEADVNLRNALMRVKGVSDVVILGARKYAMRLWLDPVKLAANGLTAQDVVNALNEQNVQVAAGQIGAPPSPAGQPYELNVHVDGMLTQPQTFANLILKSSDGTLIHLSDVGRVDLGAEDYSTQMLYNGKRGIGLLVYRLPDANSLDVAAGIRRQLSTLSQSLPPGVHLDVAFDDTRFVHQSIEEIVLTLVAAVVLVVLVIFLFLQDWRSTLIPAITIPVSLIGTFAALKALGLSISTLTLFAITLATGLVVDDAILVVENIVRHAQERRLAPTTAAVEAMREITGPVVATSLVLVALFIPVAFFPGTTGQVYKQFGVTIACSIIISAFTALTLAPALAARILGRPAGRSSTLLAPVSTAIARMRGGYKRLLPLIVRRRAAIVALFVLSLGATAFLAKHVPKGFVPNEDQGYFVITVQGPEGSSLQQTIGVLHRVDALVAAIPEAAMTFDIAGFGFNGYAPNQAVAFVRLTDWSQRRHANQSLDAVIARLRGEFLAITQAQVLAFNPPPIPGVGSVGGFQLEMEDRGDVGYAALTKAASTLIDRSRRDPALASVYTTFRDDSPTVDISVDRTKAKELDVPLDAIFGTLQIMLGSDYVNDFDYQNRPYRVYVQAGERFRSRIADLHAIFVRSQSGQMLPLDTFVTVSQSTNPPAIFHYDLYRSIEIGGSAAPGHSSGEAIAEMQRLAKQILPPGVAYEWSGTSLDETQAGGTTTVLFALGVLLVFLVLAAQYESLVDPFIIILAVPLAIFGALGALALRGLQDDIFAQVGFLMLVGLAAKNAILIVEFANHLRRAGMSPLHAAFAAAKTRLRPILMTSFAFIFGVLPLVFASGAGAASRHSLGTAVVGGMILSTVLNLFVTPLLYLLAARYETTGRPSRTQASIPPARLKTRV